MDHIRYGHGHVLAQQQQQYGRPVSSIDAAHASEYFEHFINATSLKTILGYHRSICDHLHLKPNLFPLFYPKLRANLTTWKAKALLKKFDARAAHKCYGKGKICANTRVLIIGAGPCGLRTAIEAQLLGAKVVVVEKRDRLSRNNVLHLWPFVIEDLRALGAKKFFGKFCAGAIDHISIRQLQCILLKVALLLGVEIHTEVSFEKLIEPSATEKTGWRAEFKPADHPVAQYEFDVIIGADGKRNTLQGFNRKEFRGKLAIAITANFINKKTEAEARVEEISGVAFIFNQKFFKDLYEETKIDLENIVYYKDDTHYFVMTAKKASLLEKGVIKQDLSDTEKLLAMENVDRDALQEYAKEAANFSTDYQMPDLEFAVNHYGQPDVAMFDFTSMYAAENASKTMERNGHQLLMILVGDSLLEPFWPTGSGCARGFLSSLDAAWAIRSWASPTTTPLDVLAERESIYRLLAQTTPDNLNKEWKSYTLDPITRYPNLNKNVVMPHQVISLYDTDNPDSIEQMRRAVREVTPVVEVPRKRRHGDVDNDVLFNWIAEQVKGHEDITLTDLESVLKDGKVLCAIIHHYRPDLLDYNAIKDDNPAKNNQLAFDLLEKELGIPPIVTGEEITNSVDYLTMVSYLTQVYHTFRGEIPHIKHQKLSLKKKSKNKNRKRKMSNLGESDYVATYSKKSCTLKFTADKSEPTKINLTVVTENSETHSCIDVSKKSSSRTLFKGTSKKSSKILDCKNDKFDVQKSANLVAKSIKNCYNIRYNNYSKDLKQEKSTHSRKLIQNTENMPQLVDETTKNSKTTKCNKNRKSANNLEQELKPSPSKNIKRNSEGPRLQNLNKSRPRFRKKVNEPKFVHILYPVDPKRKLGDIEVIKTASSHIEENVIRSVSTLDIEQGNITKDTSYETVQNGEENDEQITYLFQNKNFGTYTNDDDGLSRNNEKSLKSNSATISVINNTCNINPPECSKTDLVLCSKENLNFPKKDKHNAVNIQIVQKTEENCYKCQRIIFEPTINVLTISKQSVLVKNKIQSELYKYDKEKITNENYKLQFTMNKQENNFNRISTWVNTHDFSKGDYVKDENEIIVNIVPRTEVVRCDSCSNKIAKQCEIISNELSECILKTESKCSQLEIRKYEPEIKKSKPSLANKIKKKLELPETKRSDATFKMGKLADYQQASQRQSARHKRHAEPFSTKANVDRKTRKRRTLERVGTSVDHDNKLPSLNKGGNDEDLQARIKNLENKWKDPQPVERKPKDLLRAIGKLDTNDWNVKEIEKKIMENKLGKPSNKDKEKVPKWSKEQFLARQTKMENKHLDRQDSTEAKFADIDKNIKHLDMKLKEGTVRELGQNKVASITEKLVSKVPTPTEQKPVEKNTSRPQFTLPTQAASEFCHFCDKRVYLMERLSAEGRFFHHGCFKCQYCHTQLRLGSYSFDRDGQYGHKFFCVHHYGMQGELPRPTRVVRKPSQKHTTNRSPDKKRSAGVAGLDLLDRVQTPERIEFANLSSGSVLSDNDEPLTQMDEDEWTDKNFGASCAELDDTDESSSYSDSDSDDDEEAYDDALEEPATKEGTLRLAQKLKYYRKKNLSESDEYSSSDQSSYDENSSDDEDSDTATEGEEEIRARELRKQEVRVEPPLVHPDTGTDTEVVSDETSSESSSEIQNSATEISTDSEFAHDDPTPTREIPKITFNDVNVTKTRGSTQAPKRIQVTTGYLQQPVNGNKHKQDIELKLSPLVPSAPIVKKPAPVLQPRPDGYALNRTQSTGGIAAKKSLELKKKYLLGESGAPGGIQKSGSASTLDTKFKSFQTDISDCQKLLRPAAEISASMKVFCSKLDELSSSKLSPGSSPQLIAKELNTQEKKQEEPVAIKPLPPPDVTKDTEKAEPYQFQNELEGRPRSPVHETSIIVPQIDWSKTANNDSHSEDSLSITSSSGNECATTPNFQFPTIPKVEVHTPVEEDDIPPDSLCIVEPVIPKPEQVTPVHSEPSKSITSEKKTLNQPKSLPYLERMLPEIHNSLHVRYKKDEPETAPSKESNLEIDNKSSGRSTPDSGAEQVTVALTETELSDWAKEGEVSDDLEEFAEFELNESVENRSNKKPKEISLEGIKKADMEEFEDFGHVCGKEKDKLEEIVQAKNTSLLDGCKSLKSNLDNIEYMDTGTETSSDDGIVDSQDGYVLFKNDDELPEDSLNPTINEVVEAHNDHITSKTEPVKNTGYCIISNSKNNFGSEVIDLKPSDLEKLKQKQLATEHDDDSLLIVDTGTTTEENTCSDSTVKNVTEIIPDKPKLAIENNNSQKIRMEEKLASVKAELKQISDKNLQSSQTQPADEINLEFDEHCQRLQSKIEFGNAKDSIDIRKSRRKSKSELPQKPDLIQEERDKPSPVHTAKDITLNLTPTIPTPDVLYKRENIKRERDMNQKLIQEMVMNKMKAENKPLERKRRNRTPSKPYDITKSATSDISQLNIDNSNRNSTFSNTSIYSTPDVLLSTNSVPLQHSQSVNTVPSLNTSSEYSTPLSLSSIGINSRKSNDKQGSLNTNPNVNNKLFNDFQTPKAPPRQKYEELSRTSEKMKQAAREKVRQMSNEALGLSPEDKYQTVKDKHCKKGKENSDVTCTVQSLEPRNSWLHLNNTLTRKKNNSTPKLASSSNNLNAPTRTKSISGINNNYSTQNQSPDSIKMCKSDPNLLDTEDIKHKKKSKGEGIKNFFRRSQTFFKNLSPKKIDKAKSCSNLDPRKSDEIVDIPIRRKSYSEWSTDNVENISPPPIPPLPVNYTGNSIKGTDESSDGEHDWKKHELSSCDTLDQTSVLDHSIVSVSGRRSKSAKKTARQTQLKRHRMAQEIQRKLEETEVKTRELEKRGVTVEKALRGEDSEHCSKEESELLQEWFDLMRDRTELRRYEKELMVRAQELELEDRHARLQQDLRERLETDKKTEDDVKCEEKIIAEMLEIVSKRDSLIAILEEDRLRYSHEDRDLEEQMLAKGLRLTPIRKTQEN
ncbi:F-actin-monooxygenase Mical isoform X3 [Aethina tumida]|uniref:F-actin-monooxygenase Mical isoform X3 n=1 Tax=Aethina tumida TaxID=116153 RepID=UPI002149323D|nr:F-actin-monooxygenase Mical isoform X3 [Aethina tumida]